MARTGDPTPELERWWHVFAGESDSGNVVMTLGASTEHPEHLVARGATEVNIGACFGLEEDHTLRYVWSFNHEPTDEEMDVLRAELGFSPWL